MSGEEPQRKPNPSWLEIGLTALVVIFVALSPFSIVFGRTSLLTAFWINTALTLLAAALAWRRVGIGCLELFVPFVTTVWLIGFTAARPAVFLPWIPAVHVLALVLLVVGLRRHRRRAAGAAGGKSRIDVR